MRTLIIFLPVLFTILAGACFYGLPRNLTDNAYERIDDVSIRLIYKHQQDSLVRTDYEKRYNLPGNYCTQIETTDSIHKHQRMGIAIRCWTSIVMKEGGTFYGPYPKNGLPGKIKVLKIFLGKDHLTKDITDALRGDSVIQAFVWKNHQYKKTPLSWYNHQGGLKPLYFETVGHWMASLNERPDMFQGFSRYDFLFWFEHRLLDSVGFEPAYLKIEMLVSDSTGNPVRTIADSTRIKM